MHRRNFFQRTISKPSIQYTLAVHTFVISLSCAELIHASSSTSDPTRFTPKPNSQGDIIHWGIPEYDDEDGEALMHKVLLQSMAPHYHATLVPQVQFIKFLIKQKVSEWHIVRITLVPDCLDAIERKHCCAQECRT